jgi:uncharacterized protein YjiS (DUF1127 family)
MANISTHQQSLALPSTPTRSLRRPLVLLKDLFRSRRSNQIDFRFANEHMLKDIGITRSHEAPPVYSLVRIL